MAGGLPPALTQEDFLVIINFQPAFIKNQIPIEKEYHKEQGRIQDMS